MKQNLLKTMLVLAFAAGTTAVAAEPVRQLVRTLKYGDAMGDAPKDVDMSKSEYFYDSDNRLMRVVESGRTYGEGNKPLDYKVMYLYKYEYAADGLSSTCTTYQTGLYDYGDMGWKDKGTETTTYDSDGRVVSEVQSMYLVTYEYDEAGNVVKMTKASKSSGKVSQEFTYSDFVGKDKPKTIVSTSPSYSTYRYTATCEYDEAGNKLSELQVYTDEKKAGEKKQLETWTYEEDGFLRQYNKYTSFEDDGTPKPYSKRCYWLPDETNPNRIMYSDSTWTASQQIWSGSGRPTLEEYADFGETAEATVTTLAVSLAEGKINTVRLDIAIPEGTDETKSAFNIYCDGALIDTKWAYELEKTDGKATLSYIHEGLYNGDHDYFVQMLTGNSNDIDDYVGYSISNPASISLSLELPPVTNLKAVDHRKGDNSSDIVTFTWTNPEYPEDYGFISNDLYLGRAQLSESSTDDAAATSLEGSFYSATLNVFVLTRFKYGKAFSETITVNLADVPTGIAAASTTAGTISLNGRMLNIGRNADITVCSFDGKTQAKAAAARGIDLSRLAAGTYIICVGDGKATEAYKVVLK